MRQFKPWLYFPTQQSSNGGLVSPLERSAANTQEHSNLERLKNIINPSVPAALNWRIMVQEKIMRETEISLNLVDSVKTSNCGFSIIH